MSRRGGVMDNRLHNKLLRISFFTQFDGERVDLEGEEEGRRHGARVGWRLG
jgi:hypothetical protein